MRLLGDGSHGGERKVMGCEEVQRVVFSVSRGKEVRGGGKVADGEDEGDGGIGEGYGSGNEREEVDAADDDDDDGDGGVRLPTYMEPSQASSCKSTPTPTSTSTSASIGISKTRRNPPLTLQQWGLEKAKEREQVRQAARRGVAFGFEVANEDGETSRRRVEAVQYGRVVEASFAKGSWGVRWRD